MARLMKKEVLPKAKVYDVGVDGTHCFFAASRDSRGVGSVLAHNCHRMSRDSQDVLLKPLEDKRLVGIFCTTEPSKIRGTIRSRCEEYPIRKITREVILERMKSILGQEGVEYQDDAVLTVIDHCGGHVRDVLNRLEMIAQVGGVTIDVVRDYLELGLVSVYYKVLLSLGSPAEAVGLVEDACNRVGVDDVVSGLAEAAMNSYRLAHGMFAEFTYVDKELAQEVYKLYGDGVVRLAEYFLGRRASKVSLICDIVRCAGGVPAKEAVNPIAVAPVIVNPPPSTPAVNAAPEVIETPTTPPANPPPTSTPKAPAVTPKDNRPKKSIKREDGIGNRGSSDIRALTCVDESGVPVEMPRGSEAKPPLVPKSKSKKTLEKILTPDEWARVLAAALRARGIDV